jgi:hypothetical protein
MARTVETLIAACRSARRSRGASAALYADLVGELREAAKQEGYTWHPRVEPSYCDFIHGSMYCCVPGEPSPWKPKGE